MAQIISILWHYYGCCDIYLLAFISYLLFDSPPFAIIIKSNAAKQTLTTKRKVMTRGNLCICMWPSARLLLLAHKSCNDLRLARSTCTVNQKRRNLYILMLPWDWYGGLKRKTLGQMWPHQQQRPPTPPPLSTPAKGKNTPKTDPRHTQRERESDSRLSPEWKEEWLQEREARPVYVCVEMCRDRSRSRSWSEVSFGHTTI